MSTLTPPAVGLPMIRLEARPKAFPVGLVLGGTGLAGALLVSFFNLDRLGLTLCALKLVTGVPCPTCGGTRAAAHLARFDLAGAVAMNPLVAVTGLIVGAWFLADLVLWPRRRALSMSVSPRMAAVLRVLAVAAVALNWLYLVLAGR